MVRPLPRRMDYFQTILRNMCTWSTLDGTSCQWHLSNLPESISKAIKLVYKNFVAPKWRTVKYAAVKVFYVRFLKKVVLTLIFPLHLLHGGAKNCSKQYSQYKSPFSSTNPMSINSRLQFWFTHKKWAGHQVLPSAVTNGPLYT